MAPYRIALANLRFPATPAESIELAVAAIRSAALASASVIAFPECYVPGYRAPGRNVPPPDPEFLNRAWDQVAAAAREAKVAIVLGTERVVAGQVRATALAIGPTGSILGWQDKVQLDPSEDTLYAPGEERCVFEAGPLRFGVAICHEGWRYPETVRWAARRGAQIVFHPQAHFAEPGGYRPTSYGEPGNSFHEKAVMCRAAENTCYFATINYAEVGSPATSALAGPDGSLMAWQPYGVEGLLLVDVDLDRATGLLAQRYRPLEL
jgi:predicted amidohydrolase